MKLATNRTRRTAGAGGRNRNSLAHTAARMFTRLTASTVISRGIRPHRLTASVVLCAMALALALIPAWDVLRAADPNATNNSTSPAVSVAAGSGSGGKK